MMPEPHAIAVMALTVVALYFFSRDSIPIETSSLLVITLLTLGFSIFPYRGPEGEFDPLRFFAGLTTEQAAMALGVSVSTAENDWAYARSWLRLEIAGTGPPDL